MVPALLYLLFKKIRKQNWGKIKRNFVAGLLIRSNQIIVTLVILLLLVSYVLAAQKQARNYKVIRKGSEIGWVSLEKLTDSNSTIISMGSEIKARFLFTFSSAAKEVSEFRDGKLLHSYFYRKANGNVKADRHTRLVGNSYEIEDRSEKTKLNISPVTFNTLCMYFQEPVDQAKVYSDNQQCFLGITKEADGGYKIIFSDGSSNSFYYTHGVCYKVKIDDSFYSAELLLK
jgi:hypothetical protein